MQNCYWITPLGRSVDVLLRHLPLGRAWLGFRTKQKRAYRIIQGLAAPFEDAWTALCALATELSPYQTTDLIGDWEAAVGLPDACLPSAVTIEQRRAQIVYRLSKRRWTTAQDWKDLALLFNLVIQITPGWYVQRLALFGDGTPPGAEWDFPLSFDSFPRLGRFRVYIDVVGIDYVGFEYGGGLTSSDVGFPIPFGDSSPALALIQCIFDRIRPANVVIIWNNNPLRNGCYTEPFSEAFSSDFCSPTVDS